MRYYIKRNEQEYGPYSEEDLRRYVSEGSIVMTDAARPENSTATVPVSEILNPSQSPPAPAPTPPAPTPPQTPPYGTPQQSQQTPAWETPTPEPQPQQQQWGAPGAGQPQQQWGAAPAGQPGAGPMPPDLHWALVLIIALVTCSIFGIVWQFIQASYAKRIDQESKAIWLYILALVIPFCGGVLGAVVAGATGAEEASAAFSLLGVLVGIPLNIAGAYSIKASLEKYFNTVEPINLRMSGVMPAVFPFFINTLYLQHHCTRIANWKRTGVLS